MDKKIVRKSVRDSSVFISQLRRLHSEGLFLAHDGDGWVIRERK